MIASFLFHVGHSLHVVPTGVEMYSVTVMRNITEFCKRSNNLVPLRQRLSKVVECENVEDVSKTSKLHRLC